MILSQILESEIDDDYLQIYSSEEFDISGIKGERAFKSKVLFTDERKFEM